jgi:hypothetical protein
MSNYDRFALHHPEFLSTLERACHTDAIVTISETVTERIGCQDLHDHYVNDSDIVAVRGGLVLIVNLDALAQRASALLDAHARVSPAYGNEPASRFESP